MRAARGRRRSGGRGPATYAAAGVDYRRAGAFLRRIAGLVRGTRGPQVLKDPGAFAGLYALSTRGLREPVLVASTDGVGTKLTLATLLRRHDTIGVDLVAMNANDVVTFGARPLFFLDYLAVGRIDPRTLTAVMRGVARGCREAGCALLGGETAELPGFYPNGGYDLAGFCVGVAERRALIDGSRMRRGDLILGVASSGFHANGFSLLRRVLPRRALVRLAPALLRPTRLYVKPILALVRACRPKAIAHITGGGLVHRLDALARRAGLARCPLDRQAWPVPTLFREVQACGRISEEEMFTTFNMGIGLAIVCAPRDARATQRALARWRLRSWVIGAL